MTAELEYSFIDVMSDLRIANELMTRAVRVKQAVRDKLSRIYAKNLVNTPVVNNENTVEVENNEVNNVIPNVQPEIEVNVEVKPTLADLVDLSEENLKLLSSKLDALELQQKVSTVTRRAVLFTNNLIAKIENVNSKWFKKEPSVEPVAPAMEAFSPVGVMPAVEPVPTPSVDLPSVEFTNHLGGEVIPGTWDDMPEKVETPAVEPENVTPVMPAVELTPVQEEVATLPSIEPVAAIPEQGVEQTTTIPEFNSVPEVENIVPEPASIPEMPVEQEVSAEPEQNENSIPEIRLPDLDTKIKRETPDFMPKVLGRAKKDEKEEEPAVAPLPELTPVPEVPTEEVPVAEQPVEAPKAEEPAPVEEQPAEIPANEFVPEPTEITGAPVEEKPVEEPKEEEPEVEPEAETEPEVKVEEEPAMSIEDRIAELLNKKKEEKPAEEETKAEEEEKTPEVEPEPETEEAPEEEESVPEVESETEEVPEEPEEEQEEKPEISQAAIIAKLQKFSNSMKEKEAEIKSLKEKNQKLSDDNASIKEKMNSYDTVVKDLTNKNNDLTAENEKLINKNDKIEEKYKDKVENLENQVDELTKAKKEEIESSKNAINEIKERYEKEIEELKKKYAEDLKKTNESNERKIQAIYNTISETLGETYTEDQEKTM